MTSNLQKVITTSVDNIRQISEEVFSFNNIVLGGLVLLVALFIQLFFPPGTRSISRKTWIENFSRLPKLLFILGSLTVPQKYLKVYRCPSCNKLLAKGHLAHKDDILEVKCRGCSTICLFKGEDVDIIEKRSELLKEGLIPDPDPDSDIEK
jgi:phage FluMu protein Com